MVRKIQIMVRVCELDVSNDYIVPAEMAISDIVQLIARIVFPAGHPALDNLNRFVLFDADRKVVCPADRTAEGCGLIRGSSLILV